MVSAYERDRRQPTLATLMRLLKAAGYELRVHLEPYDDHDDVLAEKRAAWPQEKQTAWESYQRHRVAEARKEMAQSQSGRQKRPVG